MNSELFWNVLRILLPFAPRILDGFRRNSEFFWNALRIISAAVCSKNSWWIRQNSEYFWNALRIPLLSAPRILDGFRILLECFKNSAGVCSRNSWRAPTKLGILSECLLECLNIEFCCYLISWEDLDRENITDKKVW